MYDHSLFLRTLSEFSARLFGPYDVDTVLRELMERLTAVLGSMRAYWGASDTVVR